MFCTNCGKEDKGLGIKNPVCKACGFDMSYVLGLIAAEDDEDMEDELRSSISCAQRCVILYCIVAAGHGVDRPKIVKWLKQQELWSLASENEQRFLNSAEPTEQQLVNATWRIEALHLLLWSLNKVETDSSLSEMCSVEDVQAVCGFFLEDSRAFIKSSELRTEAEIDIYNEQIYQAHWKVRDAKLNGKAVPDKLEPSVIKERHYAVNWLTGYCGQEWDDITTDT